MCSHHRQRLSDGTLLPCAQVGCTDGIASEELVISVPGHMEPRRWFRHTAAQRLSGGIVKLHYSWREE